MQKLLDFIYPRECLGCGRKGPYLCFECKKTLLAHPEICPFCHQASKDYKTCSSCRHEEKGFLDGLIIGFSYQNLLKKLILKVKFYHKKDIARFLAERLALLLQMNQTLIPFLDKKRLYISFVPSHRYRKFFQKGYNQSELLAFHLAKCLDIQFLSLFKKKKSTVSQVSLTREKRFKNLNNVFELLPCIKDIPRDSVVILVDDVTTTGATLNELAKTLKKQRKDISVWGIVVARNTK